MRLLSTSRDFFLPSADRRPSLLAAALAVAGGVAAATAAIYPLAHFAPVVSLSVVYLPVVLLLSAFWGLAPGLATAVCSALAFNFFHLPPVGRFTVADFRNWVALAAFTVVAAATSAIAEVARTRSQEADRRRGEADLAAALARELLAGVDTRLALAGTAHRIAVGLELGSAAIELGSRQSDARRTAIPLRDGSGHRLATLLVPRELPDDTAVRLRTRVAPTLEALIAIALHRDQLLAETVETEALRRSDEVKTALLRSVSHDLRTPLTAIVAAGHALGSGRVTDEDREELANAVVSEGGRLASLVEKLLDLSRLESGNASPRREWVSLEDVLLSARDVLPTPRPEIRLSVPTNLPEVQADAAQLERVFANLLENACRYAAGAPISINAAHRGKLLTVSVTDQGPGIPSAELERIFEPFYRGDEAGAAAKAGSGLGLAIARGFTAANGGHLTATSLPGQGTTFTVALPV